METKNGLFRVETDSPILMSSGFELLFGFAHSGGCREQAPRNRSDRLISSIHVFFIVPLLRCFLSVDDENGDDDDDTLNGHLEEG
jgi:hypothetical protein